MERQKFSVDVAATAESLTELWSTLKEIDSKFNLLHTDNISRKTLSATLQLYLKHFDIKKCGVVATCVSLLVYLQKNLQN